MRGVPKIKSGSSWFPHTPLADTFLYRALVRINGRTSHWQQTRDGRESNQQRWWPRAAGPAVASCDSVCAQLQSWTQTLELGQAVSRPSPKELGLVRVEAQSVGGHPTQSVNWAAAAVVSSRWQCRYNCVSSAKEWRVTPCRPTMSTRSATLYYK